MPGQQMTQIRRGRPEGAPQAPGWHAEVTQQHRAGPGAGGRGAASCQWRSARSPAAAAWIGRPCGRAGWGSAPGLHGCGRGAAAGTNVRCRRWHFCRLANCCSVEDTGWQQAHSGGRELHPEGGATWLMSHPSTHTRKQPPPPSQCSLREAENSSRVMTASLGWRAKMPAAKSGLQPRVGCQLSGAASKGAA